MIVLASPYQPYLPPTLPRWAKGRTECRCPYDPPPVRPFCDTLRVTKMSPTDTHYKTILPARGTALWS
jgi:hypothetical protein